MAAKQDRDTRQAAETTEPLLSANVELEADLLRNLISAPQLDMWPKVRAHLKQPQDFYRNAHQLIYQAGCAVYDAGGIPERSAIADELQRTGMDPDDAARDALWELAQRGWSLPFMWQDYAEPAEKWHVHAAEQLAERARKRGLVKAAGILAAYAADQSDTTAAEGLAKADEALAPVRQSLTAADGPRFLDDDELDAVPPARGILGNIIYEQSFAILYGPSGRWKSFIALAWALAIATGQTWLGHRAAEGDVFYVAAEGGLGIRNRVRAWKRRHGVTKTRLKTLLAPVNLLDPAGVQSLIAQIRAQSATPAVVVLDTLSRCMPGGDENGGKDGSAAVAAVDAIRAALGCTVLVVAHPGKDEARGIRGWSGYFNAADTVIRVTGGGNEAIIEPGTPITLHCDKPKDAEAFRDMTLTAEIEKWATDEGAIESSLVIVPCDATAASKPDMFWTENRRTVYDALWKLQADSGVSRLRPSEIEAAIGDRLPHNRIMESLKALSAARHIMRDDSNGPTRPRYYITPDGPVGPVRSIFGPDGPGINGPVRSGVSIDTGPTDHAPDRRVSGQWEV